MTWHESAARADAESAPFAALGIPDPDHYPWEAEEGHSTPRERIEGPLVEAFERLVGRRA